MNGYLLGPWTVFQCILKVLMLWLFSVLLPGNVVPSGSPSAHLTYNLVVAMLCYLTDYPRYRLVIELPSAALWGRYFFPLCSILGILPHYVTLLCYASIALALIGFLLGVPSFGAIVS
jgi:hypothetical protein